MGDNGKLNQGILRRLPKPSVPIIGQKVPPGLVAFTPDAVLYKKTPNSKQYNLNKVIPIYEQLQKENVVLCDRIELLCSKVKGLERKLSKLTKEDDCAKTNGVRAEKPEESIKGLREESSDKFKEQVSKA